MPTLAELIELGDLDELVRHIDRLCTSRDWDELVRLRDLSRAALDRGKQLWPAASHAEYRLALEAPASYAAAMLVPGSGHLALGPLTEVAAQHHTWAELEPHAPPGPAADVAAQERVVRGEHVEAATLSGTPDVPTALAPWEPAYPLAQYEAAAATFPAPPLPALSPVELPSSGARLSNDAGVDALRELTRPWTIGSNGRSEAVAVRGSAFAAIAALGVPRARAALVAGADALALMAWTAASGGAHGRRRGMAYGRFAAWWATACIAGVEEPWPPDPSGLGAALAELRFWIWDAAEPLTGWSLHLAVEDPEESLAWAIAAADAD
jgi:hypothetical protein